MRRTWFKFYGQDFLTDPKMLELTSPQKVMWIALLCLVSSSEEEGMIHNITEERLKLLAGILPNSTTDDEWSETEGTLKHFEKLGMIKVSGESINVLNFVKRQLPQDSYDPDAIKERVKRYRNKSKSLPVTKCNDRVEKSRVEESRVEENRIDILPKGKKQVSVNPDGSYGNQDINELTSFLKETLGLKLLDGSAQANRRFCYLALKKFKNKENIKAIIQAAAQNDFWRNKITDFKGLYYQGVKIVSSIKDNKNQWNVT